MTDTKVVVERLTKYSTEDAAGIGRLMPFLSSRLTEQPMAEALLMEIISSPYHEQLVARLDAKIVGAATLNLLMGPAVQRMGYLEDFVTDPKIRLGVGDKIWHEISLWCQQNDINLSFTSSPDRLKAHEFYLSHGATVRNTTVFKMAFRNE